MTSVLEKRSFSGTPAIFLNTLQENEYISLLLSPSFSVSAKLTFPSILAHRLLLYLCSSNTFSPLWPPGCSSEGLIGVYLCPFHHLVSDRNSLLCFLFFPVTFAYDAVTVFHVAILNCCTDHPEQEGKPSCSDSHLVSSMQNRKGGMLQVPW